MDKQCDEHLDPKKSDGQNGVLFIESKFHLGAQASCLLPGAQARMLTWGLRSRKEQILFADC
jgi:hypothetical protein